MDTSSDLLNEFIVEAKGHIAEMEAGLLRMEEIGDDDNIISEVFRAAHSIKGTAGFFELNKNVELAHVIENLFGELREHHLKVSLEMIDALLLATDLLKELISNPIESEKYDITGHVACIKRFLGGVQDRDCGLSAWDLWNQLTSSDEETIDASGALTTDESSNQPEPIAAKSVSGTSLDAGLQAVVRYDGKSHAVNKEGSVRVNVGLLNDLLNLAGEMVLRRNQLLRITQDADRQSPQLDVVAKGIDELTTNLQKTVMKTRLQPIANVFNKFPRIVRDLSRKVGKEVNLTMRGIDVELDRSLVEALVDPMTHLLRNAMDHGIEPSEVRQRKNKPVTGSLVLQAYHESGRVIVEVSDDGAGIDLERIKGKAVERGLVGKEAITTMRDVDILNLIMTPGFSTAEQVTDISGRGVGMDVVKTNIEKLGGKIEIFSEVGVGTTFRLILPLTLAIISSFIVMVGEQTFVIPQANVRELLLIQAGETSGKRVEKVQNRPVLRLRGRLLPLVRLGALIYRGKSTPEQTAIDDYFLDSDQTLRILVIKSGKSVFGLVVDCVYDTEEILVKPLSPVLGNSGLYSGATVLGDGNIAMILDMERLAALAGISLSNTTNQTPDTQSVRNIDAEKQYLLLFRCSGGEMLGLDLSMVSRVEKVDVSRLQKIGSKYYFSFQGQTTRVIQPEHYLPISRKKNKPSKVYVILPKLVKHRIGIIAEEIYDSVFAKVSLDTSGVCGKGILGSTLINDTIVTLVNIHELFAEAAPEYYNFGDDSLSNRIDENRKSTILLVEDTPFFLRVVKSYLESEGYEVVTAENGREALDKLLRIKVDVVVSDIEMPIMSGIELVRAIRASTTLRHLPVIALTSLTGETNKEKGLRAGFDLYEFKLDRARLLERVNELLRKRT